MAATIRVGKTEATIRGYAWDSTDPMLTALLNAMLDPLGPSGADPNPDHTAALGAVSRLGGELVGYDRVKTDPGAIY